MVKLYLDKTECLYAHCSTSIVAIYAKSATIKQGENMTACNKCGSHTPDCVLAENMGLCDDCAEGNGSKTALKEAPAKKQGGTPNRVEMIQFEDQDE